jgi:hypothetical protein
MVSVGYCHCVRTSEDDIAWVLRGHDCRKGEETVQETCLIELRTTLRYSISARLTPRHDALDDWYAVTNCFSCLDMQNHISMFAITDHPPLCSTEPVSASISQPDVRFDVSSRTYCV